MASIMGLTLKGCKKTLGREGYGLLANMYLNGKMVGRYEDYGDGAMEDIDYVSKEAERELMELTIKYAKTRRNDFLVTHYQEFLSRGTK